MKILVRALIAAACFHLLVSCGGGVSSDNASSATTFTLQPGTAEAYAGVELVFTINGGQPPYTVSSSNAVVAPVATASISTKSFSIVPQYTSAAVPVVITVFDHVGAKVESTLNVNPNIISNIFTITPIADLTGATGASCGIGATICAGGYGLVTVKLVSTTIPIANRLVRFDVEQGAFTLLQNISGTVTALSYSTTTDGTGTATVTLRADTLANSQVAVLRFTDVATGSIQRATFVISRGSSSVLAVLPASASLLGPRKNACATGVNFDFLITGGLPPYFVSSSIPAVAFVVNNTVLNDGGRFTAQTAGQVCGVTTFAIVDASGRVATATLDNKEGTDPAPTIQIQPQAGSLGCGGSGSFSIAGGTGVPPYAITSSSNFAPITNSTTTLFTVTRLNNGTIPGGNVSIGVSDGFSNASITIVVPVTCP